MTLLKIGAAAGLALGGALALSACSSTPNEAAQASANAGNHSTNAAQVDNAHDLNAPNSVTPGAAGTSPSGGSNNAPRSSGSNAAPGPDPIPGAPNPR